MAAIDIRFPRVARSLIGLLVGSFGAAACLLFIPTAFGDHDFSFAFEAIVPAAVLISFLAFPCGFTAHALLYTQKWRAVPVYCLAAAIEATLYGLLTSRFRFDIPSLQAILSYAAASAICAAIAWLARRPDLDSKRDE